MQNETNLSVWPAYSGLRILITSKQRRANICKRLKIANKKREKSIRR